MKGYIYKITNLINNKKYIGKHNGNKPDYMGSGILLKHAIKKYGIKNFIKEILCECNTEDELCKMEKFYINVEDAVNNPNYYNMHAGGQGGFIEKKPGVMSTAMKTYWNNLSEEAKFERTKNIGIYDKRGNKNPKARRAEINGKEYECLKDALEDYPEIPYSSLKTITRLEQFPNKYNIIAKYL